jgi:hypothetical protein
MEEDVGWDCIPADELVDAVDMNHTNHEFIDSDVETVRTFFQARM